MSSWDIIVWVGENSVDVVPSSWAITPTNEKYVYPKAIKPSKLEKLKRLCLPPSDKYEYLELDAEFKRTIHSYDAKDKYMNQLQYASNLEETDNDEGNTSLPSQSNVISHNVSVNNYIAEDEIGEKFDKIMKVLSKLEFHVIELKHQMQAIQMNNISVTGPANTEEWPLQLPISNNEQFQASENFLATKKDALVKIISLVGGNSMRHYITLMLKKLLAKSLALDYSARGRKGKKSFVDTKLYLLIIDAVRVRYANATDIEIAQMIGFSLANASDWDGGSSRTKNKTNQ